MNVTLDFAGYLSREAMELWWQLETEPMVALSLYGAGIGALCVGVGYLLFRRCSRVAETDVAEGALAKIHYYAGCTPDNTSTNACIDLLMKHPELVNTPLWKHCSISHGYTPFLRACWNNNFKLIHFMLKIGADVKLTNSDGESPLYLVAYRVSKSPSWDSRALKLLWESGCSVDEVNVHNNSMLHLAAKAGNATLTRWLLLHGADPDISNASGFTPFALALRKGSPAHLQVANLLRTPLDVGCPQRQFVLKRDDVEISVKRSVSQPVMVDEDLNMTI